MGSHKARAPAWAGFRQRQCLNVWIPCFASLPTELFRPSPEPLCVQSHRVCAGVSPHFACSPDYGLASRCVLARPPEPQNWLFSSLARSFELKACLKTVQLTSNAFCFSFIIACHAMFFESLLIYYLFHFFPFSLFLHAVPPVSSLPPILCSRL